LHVVPQNRIASACGGMAGETKPMNVKFNTALIAAVAGAMMTAQAAMAAPVLDQQFDPGSLTGFTATAGVGGIFYNAQTFTVGLDGQLTGVEFLANAHANSSTADIVLDIRGTTGGAPIGDNSLALASVALSPSAIGHTNLATYTFFHVDLTAFNINVSTGDVLAMVIYTSQPNFSWKLAAGSSTPAATYAGGSRWTRDNFTTGSFLNIGGGSQDMYFKTFVDADTGSAELPAPGGLALLGLGLAGLGALRRRTARA
jgi:hypothetical protein